MVKALLSLSVLFVACSPPPGSCPTMGTGSISVTFDGLPAGAEGKVTLQGSGSQTLTSAQTVSVSAGNWTVVGDQVVIADPIVRTVYAAGSTPTFCLANNGAQVIAVTWTKVPTSNRLWLGNGSGGMGTTHAFDSSTLGATASIASSWNANAAASKATAFDKEGNLWALGNTVSDPLLARFPASAFATAAVPMADRRIGLSDVSCVPGLNSLAFDQLGNAFVGSPCLKRVFKLTAASLSSSGTATPSLELKGFMSVDGLAFDKAGNLWVSDGAANELQRFDASDVAGTTSVMPARRVQVKRTDSPADTSTLKPDALAFDKDGNLWSYDFGANVIFGVPVIELSGTGQRTTTPLVRVSVAVSAVLDGLAFDEGGGLWLPYSAGKFARLSPAQLMVSTGAGAPAVPDTIITGSALGSVQGPAFFPGAKGTPLFSALP